MVSAGGAASSQPEPQAAASADTGSDVRPGLDEDRFSNLKLLETPVLQERAHPQGTGNCVGNFCAILLCGVYLNRRFINRHCCDFVPLRAK